MAAATPSPRRNVVDERHRHARNRLAAMGTRRADRRHAGGALSRRDPRHQRRRLARQRRRRCCAFIRAARSDGARRSVPHRPVSGRRDRCAGRNPAHCLDAEARRRQKIERRMLGRWPSPRAIKLWPARALWSSAKASRPRWRQRRASPTTTHRYVRPGPSGSPAALPASRSCRTSSG